MERKDKGVADEPSNFKLCHFMSCLLEVTDFADFLFLHVSHLSFHDDISQEPQILKEEIPWQL